MYLSISLLCEPKYPSAHCSFVTMQGICHRIFSLTVTITITNIPMRARQS